MTLDFRANQNRTNKIISSGSTGTGASLLIYDIAADDVTTPNQGVIDPNIFDVSTIGTDVFLYVSGTYGSKGISNSHGTTLFGGDTHTSGSFYIDNQRIIKSTDLDIGLGGGYQYTPNPSLTIAGADVFTSGSGGDINVYAGRAGSSDSFPSFDGGKINIISGEGGAGSEFAYGGSGGDVDLLAGLGGFATSGDGGNGGRFLATAGDGGYSSDSNCGNGGDLQFRPGHAGSVYGGTGGTHGNFIFYGGTIFSADQLNTYGSSVYFGPDDYNNVKRFFINKRYQEYNNSPGTDIFFYCSGSIQATDPAYNRKAVFGGDLLVSGSLSSEITKTFVPLAAYASTNATSSNPAVVGQLYFNVSEVPNNNIKLRTVLSTTNAAATATLQLYNITSGSFVEIGGPGVLTLDTTSTTPGVFESVNLMSAANFNLTASVYEVRVYTQTGTENVIHGGSQMVCGG